MSASISFLTSSGESLAVQETSAFWLILLLALVALLIGKEILVGAWEQDAAPWNRAFLIAIVPLTYLFVLHLVVSVGEYFP